MWVLLTKVLFVPGFESVGRLVFGEAEIWGAVSVSRKQTPTHSLSLYLPTFLHHRESRDLIPEKLCNSGKLCTCTDNKVQCLGG